MNPLKPSEQEYPRLCRKGRSRGLRGDKPVKKGTARQTTDFVHIPHLSWKDVSTNLTHRVKRRPLQRILSCPDQVVVATLFGKKVLHRCKQAKGPERSSSRIIQVGPKSNDTHPYRRRAERDLRHGRRRSCEDRAKVGVTQPSNIRATSSWKRPGRTLLWNFQRTP